PGRPQGVLLHARGGPEDAAPRSRETQARRQAAEERGDAAPPGPGQPSASLDLPYGAARRGRVVRPAARVFRGARSDARPGEDRSHRRIGLEAGRRNPAPARAGGRRLMVSGHGPGDRQDPSRPAVTGERQEIGSPPPTSSARSSPAPSGSLP